MFIRLSRRFFDNFSGPGDLHPDLQTFLQCSLSGCRGPTRFNDSGNCATEVVGHAFIGRQHLYSRVPTWLTGIREPASERHRRESIESASTYLGRSVFFGFSRPSQKKATPSTEAASSEIGWDQINRPCQRTLPDRRRTWLCTCRSRKPRSCRHAWR